MSKSYLVLLYGLVIAFTAMSVIGTIKIIKNENFISYKKAAPSKQKLMKKHEKKVNLVVKVLFLLWMSIVMWGLVVPGIRDIPNVLNGDYKTIEGTALTSAGTSNQRVPKIVTIQDKQKNEQIRLRFYSAKSIQKGDFLKVVYLPHLKRGTLLELESH
ncbi:hypothetical protein [Enterococcus sp. LJL51]|uniref:hypothetical protein n=1 Tax=Enterococcus sp. LJL51 TaxID=3416656 RepID=UPI003CF53BF7